MAYNADDEKIRKIGFRPQRKIVDLRQIADSIFLEDMAKRILPKFENRQARLDAYAANVAKLPEFLLDSETIETSLFDGIVK